MLRIQSLYSGILIFTNPILYIYIVDREHGRVHVLQFDTLEESRAWDIREWLQRICLGHIPLAIIFLNRTLRVGPKSTSLARRPLNGNATQSI